MGFYGTWVQKVYAPPCQFFIGQGLEKERSGDAVKSLKNDNSARTYLHILSRKFVVISTLHTSKSATNSRYQRLEFTVIPLTGIAL